MVFVENVPPLKKRFGHPPQITLIEMYQNDGISGINTEVTHHSLKISEDVFLPS